MDFTTQKEMLQKAMKKYERRADIYGVSNRGIDFWKLTEITPDKICIEITQLTNEGYAVPTITITNADTDLKSKALGYPVAIFLHESNTEKLRMTDPGIISHPGLYAYTRTLQGCLDDMATWIIANAL